MLDACEVIRGVRIPGEGRHEGPGLGEAVLPGGLPACRRIVDRSPAAVRHEAPQMLRARGGCAEGLERRCGCEAGEEGPWEEAHVCRWGNIFYACT